MVVLKFCLACSVGRQGVSHGVVPLAIPDSSPKESHIVKTHPFPMDDAISQSHEMDGHAKCMKCMFQN